MVTMTLTLSGTTHDDGDLVTVYVMGTSRAFTEKKRWQIGEKRK